MAVVIIVIGLLYFLGHYLTHFFQRTMIPDVLILILLGMVIGPVFHWATPENFGLVGNVFTSIALIVILFEGGLNLELSSVSKSMKTSSILTLLFFTISAVITAIVLQTVFHFPLMVSLITGFILGGTSSAVVLPLVNALKMGNKPSTILILESALTDVLCIVFVIGFLNGYQSGEVEAGQIIGGLISSLILASVIGIISAYVWLRLLKWIRRFPNTQFTTFAFMFVVYGIAEYFHFSGAIASLAFGIILGNYNKIHVPFWQYGRNIPEGIITEVEKSLYREIVFLLKLYFFIYLGLSIPFHNWNTIWLAAMIVGIIYVARLITTRLIIKENFTWNDKAMISVMVPKGLAAAVLAGLPLQYGIEQGEQIRAITYYVVLISILVTSLMIPLIKNTPVGYLYQWIFREDKKTENVKTSESLKE